MYARIVYTGLLHLTLAVLVSVPCSFGVVSASGAFSDDVSNILNFVQDAVGNIQDYVGEQSGCRYTCPNGSKPKRRKNHIPSTNGCGSFGFQLEKYISVKELTSCCDEHDICYDTCNNSKETCDNAFKICLEKLCQSIRKAVKKDVYEVCVSTADMMYAGTVALGCKPYKDCQKKACTCDSKTSQNIHVEL
ncbi:unnamed protein product [Candidula unifasciata]|uniref:Group XIIA secretory phospholipase A2 n=1 Tax=Candidula unifasciata TaxID=100452 RepID=A0A8S4A2R7_9EUPU|nr:unnamed protein product [Candidula unifasciata]